MNISFRIKKIASKVTNCTTLVDVGTDHAYLPIYLYKQNIVKKAIATDISKGPVENAKKNVLKYNLQDFIQVRIGNGLQTISIEDMADTCVIAGMGGSLIVNILQDSEHIVKQLDTLILQPQRSLDKVRKYLHSINFKIVEDEMFVDENRIYTLIVAKKGKEEPYSNYEYTFGKYEIEQKCPVLKEYILKEMYKMEKVLNHIQKSTNLENKDYHIKQKYNSYKEVYEWL